MAEETAQQLMATADRLANAAEALNRVLEKLDAQQEALNAKVDRIVAAVEEQMASAASAKEETGENASKELQERIATLEKTNNDLKAQSARMARKTLPPLVNSLLSKNGGEDDERFDQAVLDKTLQALSVEQRIAVKAEMARAGLIE